MRKYMTEEYKKSLVGNTFTSSDSDLKQYNGLKVVEVLKELTEEDYDRELIDDSNKNEKGESRYLINTMYSVRLENNQIIQIYEDEINPDYAGSWEEKTSSEISFVVTISEEPFPKLEECTKETEIELISIENDNMLMELMIESNEPDNNLEPEYQEPTYIVYITVNGETVDRLVNPFSHANMSSSEMLAEMIDLFKEESRVIDTFPA